MEWKRAVMWAGPFLQEQDQDSKTATSSSSSSSSRRSCDINSLRAVHQELYSFLSLMNTGCKSSLLGLPLGSHCFRCRWRQALFWSLFLRFWREIQTVECYYSHTITRFSIQTTGLAFGGTGLCSYRVTWVLEVLVQLCRAFNCRILYDHYFPTVILIIISIPSPTHSFTLGLNPSFSANPPYPSLSFFSFRFHYMDFPDRLLYYWAYPSFYFFCFTLFWLSVPCGRLSGLMSAFERTLK